MNTKNLKPLSVAIAACSHAIPVIGNDATEITLQLTPAGEFWPADAAERELKVPWKINGAIASQVINRFNQRTQPVVVDYEHQTLHKEKNGMPAPAAAWMRELIWREGEGLFVRAELTERARQYIASKEILYISPVFYFSPNGEVSEIVMASFTNTPAIHGMRALELLAAATFGFKTHTEEPEMTLLAALLAALGLDANETEEKALAVLTERLKDPLKAVRESFALPSTAGEKEILAACTSLKTQNPDPTKFVGIEVMKGMQQQMAALTERVAARDAKDLDETIEAALKDGRLLTSQKKWAKDLGKTNMAALTEYLATAKPIPGLSSSQTNGQPPVVDNEAELTVNDLAVCNQLGLSADDFKKSRQELNAS